MLIDNRKLCTMGFCPTYCFNASLLDYSLLTMPAFLHEAFLDSVWWSWPFVLMGDQFCFLCHNLSLGIHFCQRSRETHMFIVAGKPLSVRKKAKFTNPISHWPLVCLPTVTPARMCVLLCLSSWDPARTDGYEIEGSCMAWHCECVPNLFSEFTDVKRNQPVMCNYTR